MKKNPNRASRASRASAKEIKTLISASLGLILSVVILICATTSFAWFSKNREVSGTGMRVTAAVSPNLIISRTADALPTLNIADNPFSITWDEADGRSEMEAATRAAATGSALKYITNPEVIAIHSGLEKDGKTATYETVPTSDTSPFYVDYTVYIASHAVAMEDIILTARLAAPAEGTPDTHLAMTVDFYIGSVSDTNYRGTAHLAEAETATPVVLREKGTIPCADDNTPICVVMRCYFDGALQKTSSAAYVSTYSVKTDNLSLGVIIEGVEAAD